MSRTKKISAEENACQHTASISIQLNNNGSLHCIFHLHSMTPAVIERYFGKGVFEVEEAFAFSVGHLNEEQEGMYHIDPGLYPVVLENNSIIIEFKRSSRRSLKASMS